MNQESMKRYCPGSFLESRDFSRGEVQAHHINISRVLIHKSNSRVLIKAPFPAVYPSFFCNVSAALYQFFCSL